MRGDVTDVGIDILVSKNRGCWVRLKTIIKQKQAHVKSTVPHPHLTSPHLTHPLSFTFISHPFFPFFSFINPSRRSELNRQLTRKRPVGGSISYSPNQK